MVGAGAAVEPGVKDAAMFGEAQVGDGIRVRVATGLGVASATAVGMLAPGSCEASNTPASTVATETMPMAIPVNS